MTLFGISHIIEQINHIQVLLYDDHRILFNRSCKILICDKRIRINCILHYKQQNVT